MRRHPKAGLLSRPPRRPPLSRLRARLAAALLACCVTVSAADGKAPPPLQALPALDVAAYLGTWYQPRNRS